LQISLGPRGFDAGKKIKGRKRHIVTDTQGNLVGLVVREAGIQDRDGAPCVLADFSVFLDGARCTQSANKSETFLFFIPLLSRHGAAYLKGCPVLRQP
jgi:hypothetical protein